MISKSNSLLPARIADPCVKIATLFFFASSPHATRRLEELQSEFAEAPPILISQWTAVY